MSSLFFLILNGFTGIINQLHFAGIFRRDFPNDHDRHGMALITLFII